MASDARPKLLSEDDMDQFENMIHRKEKHQSHTSEVCVLVTSCFDMAHLIVGPDEVRIPCHKALLGYYSEFFEKALCRSFAEAATSEVSLPEDNPEAFKIFVSWLYTGRMIVKGCDMELMPYETINAAVELWILGDKLMAPKFANAAMECCMVYYAVNLLESENADFIYKNCQEHSELRRFIRDLIRTDGPCSHLSEFSGNESFLKAWKDLLAQGGEIVQENVIFGFSTNATKEKKPFYTANRHKYLQNFETASPKDWMKKNGLGEEDGGVKEKIGGREHEPRGRH